MVVNLNINDDLIRKINQELFESIHTWLPNAKSAGHGYQACNPIRGDRDPSSMTIYPGGHAFDFAANKSYDCINLWAAQNGIDNKDALKYHLERLENNKKIIPPKKPKIKSVESENNVLKNLLPAESISHPKFGVPSFVYNYYDQQGNLIGYTCRFDTDDGGKVVLPFTYSDSVSKKADGTLIKGKSSWYWNANGWKIWPIYGAEQVNKNPQAKILICEGEKTADATKLLLPEFVVLSWAGGASKAGKVDWSILKGRNVVIWPDADQKKNQDGELLDWYEQPGMKAALSISDALQAENPKIVIPPPNVEDGWDLADAAQEGWTTDKVLEYVANSSFSEKELDEKLGQRIETEEAIEAKSDSLIAVTYKKNSRGEPKPSIDIQKTIENYLYEHIEKKHSNSDKLSEKVDNQAKTTKSLLNLVWRDCDIVAKRTVTSEAIEKYFSCILEKKREVEIENLCSKLAWDGTDFDTTLKVITIWLMHCLIDSNLEFTDENIIICEAQARVFMHFIWQVKRKLFRYRVEKHMAPIFLGEQGNGKSEFVRNIVKVFSVPFFNFVREAYVDEIGEEKNEAILASAFINILDEMAGASKAEMNKVKHFITKEKVNPRLYYTQQAMGEIINLSTFIGASNIQNLSEILHDETGNRRFFPIKVSGFINKKFTNQGIYSDIIKEKLPWIAKTGECFPKIFDATPIWKMIDHKWPCFITSESVTKIQAEHRYEPVKQWLENFNAKLINEEEYKESNLITNTSVKPRMVSIGLLREIFVTMEKMTPHEVKKWSIQKFALELQKIGVKSWKNSERALFRENMVCGIYADWTQVETKMKLPWI